MCIEGHIAHVSQEELCHLHNLVHASKEPVDTAFYSRGPIMYSQKNQTSRQCAYNMNILVRSRNHCFKWNATVRCMCIIELRVTVSNYWALRNNAFMGNLCRRQQYYPI